MAFRYLIYRTDFGNTVVRDNPTSGTTTGGTESELLTDFVIPEIQPLYLWRITGGTDVVPNTDQNINDWLGYVYPISPDDPVTYDIFNAYTAQTATDLAGKINIVTGATGNIGEFDVTGNLIDSGFAISGLTGGSSTDVYVSGMTYVGSTLTLQRTEGLPNLSVVISTSGTTDGVVSGATLSGQTLVLSRTEGLPDVTADLSGLLTDVEADIVSLSGQVVQNTIDIQVVSGATDANAADIVYISGVTDTKQDALSAGGGISSADLAANIIAIDLSAYTAPASIGITLTGSSAFIVTDNNPTPEGIKYAANYATTFVDRSLVDKAYVDALASGLDPKDSVNVATTVDIDLTGGTFSGGSTIDGIVVVDGWRVLVKDQTDPIENGIYVYSASTSGFTRSTDFDGTPASEVTTGAFTTVVSGDTQNATSWVVVTPDPITVGTTPINWTLLSKPINYVGGVGITISGLTIIFDGASVAGNSIAWTGDTLNVDITSGTLATALAGKLDVSAFNVYSGVTDTRLTNIEGDIVTISGDVVQNTTDIQLVSGVTTQNTSDIAYISGVTDTKLDTTIFTGYTASTAANEIFLIHTGGTELNVITPVGIAWNTMGVSGSSYLWTGGTDIKILESGNYELNYNIPYNAIDRDIGIGGNIILNNSTVIDVTSTADARSSDLTASNIALPSVILTLSTNDILTLIAFRLNKTGSALSELSGSILIKKKNTLQ